MREKARKIIDKCCDAIELLIAAIVGVALLLTAGGYLLTQAGLMEIGQDTTGFLLFLENMFNLVIGIEFIKLLLKPSAEHVIEMLVFLIVRHVILGRPAAWEIALSVVCVVLLYGLNYYLHKKPRPGKKDGEKE